MFDFLLMLSNFLFYFLQDLAMKNKNKEEIKQSKRTLQFLKTLQVTVVAFVINTKHSYRFQLDEVRKPPAYTV